ncbi:MAG: phage portal protein [Patescibacteria group bacterium]|nr:phage portal protein [Patescibacteria group bacterium]
MAKLSKLFNLRKTFASFAFKAFEILNTGNTFSQGLYGEIRQPLGGVSLMGIRLSTDSLFTVWRNHGDVFACVRELKENVGSQGYLWVNSKDSNKDADPMQIKIAETALGYSSTFRALKNKIIQYQQISGSAFLLILRSSDTSRKVLGFDVIDPRTLSVVTDIHGTVYKWIQRYKGITQEYDPDEVLTFKQHDDPNTPVFGLSPLEPIIWETRTDLAAMINNYAFFANDATPGAQYILDENLNEEQQDKIIDDIKRQLQGPENRNKSIAVKGVKEIKTLQLSPKDMEFNLLRKFTTEKVCAAYGVPKAILNYTDNVNRSNGENQTQKFWEGSVTPLQDLFAEFINDSMLPVLGVDAIKIEYKSKAFNDKAWDEASSRADVEHGILTINEAREKRGNAMFDESVYGEFVNKPILWNGAGVKPLDDIGIDMNPDGTPTILSEDQATKEIQRIDRIAKRAGNNDAGNGGEEKFLTKLLNELES